MQAQTALVRANRAVELHTVAAVDLHLALIVHPRHTEGDDALRLHEAFEQSRRFVLLFVPFDNGLKGRQNFGRRLNEFRLVGVANLQIVKNALAIIRHDAGLLSNHKHADLSAQNPPMRSPDALVERRFFRPSRFSSYTMRAHMARAFAALIMFFWMTAAAILHFRRFFCLLTGKNGCVTMCSCKKNAEVNIRE